MRQWHILILGRAVVIDRSRIGTWWISVALGGVVAASRVDPAGLQEIALPVPWELPGVRPIVPPGTIDPIMPIVPPEADAEDPSDVGDEATTDEMRQCPRDCRGYLKQLRKHQEKLRLYRLNPDAYDNLGFLKGADALGLSALREQIIQRRIRNLEKQIENFKRLYERCMANNPMA